ncbi:Na+/H+ antiporter NhaA [Caldimonas tepidiphila]|uniref:Na+/H+ antiporter NhaA n=1 Tax=Caldimonas tepidiphila TaxID=2315841 RepID=UPI000E5B9C48|nr:Na+/H+ antiporter NhaA [Caldimonas tepidiphila]
MSGEAAAIPLCGYWAASASGSELASANSIGIAAEPLICKPSGVTLMCFMAVAMGICKLPLYLSWRHIFGAAPLGGIGFSMSIFITNLAFVRQPELVTSSKMAIFLASLTAGVAGDLWLQAFGKPIASDDDVETVDFEQQP